MTRFLDRAKTFFGIGGDGKTSLSGAVWATAARGDAVSLRDLLSRGADPNVVANKGYTPLHMAAENGHLAALNALLEHRADPNKLNDHGNSPLWVAVRQAAMATRTDDNLRIVERLLAAGANPDHKNAHGKSPRERASVGGEELVALFARTS